jgi:hypothetical protein
VDKQTYLITFDDASAADANRYAEELRQALLDASPDVEVHRRREDPQTQDFGATLMLLLATPAVGAIVTAIGNWLAARNRASLTIKRADGEIVVQNITSAKAAELAHLLLSKTEPPGMEVQAPSSQTTLLILLGASAWPLSPEFQSSEAFARAARRVKAYFLNPRPFGLPPENLLDLFDADNSADELDVAIGQFLEQRLAEMRAAGNAGRDLLLYFIGHGGFVGHDSDFYLAIRRTRTDSPRASGMQMLSLADTLTERARHLRRILILDCCFAAAAFSAFQAGPDQVALQKTSDAFEVRRKAVGVPTEGTTLLCSSSHKSPSLLLPDGSSTMFTKAILDTLVQGTPSWRDQFSLRDVKDIAADLLSGIRNAPRPVVLSPDQSEGDVADLPFFPNPGFEEERLRKGEEERRRRAEEEQANLAEAEQLPGANEEAGAVQAEERGAQEADKDSAHVSLSPVATTEAAAALPTRPGGRYLTAVIIGGFLSLVSILFTNVIPILTGTDPYPSYLQVLPPLVLSLIPGFLLRKSGVARPASLLAGLVVGVSWFVFILAKYANAGILPQAPPEAWFATVACAVACGPLSWLVAWLTTHPHPYDLSSSNRNEGR